MYRVFLVDDEELILQQIVRMVPWMDSGFEVIGTETSSTKALDQIIEHTPDVVFCDLKMPVIDGHTLMKEVRKLDLDIEFVMLSAYGTFEDARTFFQQEGFDYLLKPLQLTEVQLVLEKLTHKLSKKHPMKQTTEEENINSAFLDLVLYVEKNYKDKFTLEQLGKKFGLSMGYICNLFAKHYNTTLTCFVTKIRMEHAAELIKKESFSLKTVAIECGYTDYFYFNKVFRGYYGVAPSHYNAKFKEETKL